MECSAAFWSKIFFSGETRVANIVFQKMSGNLAIGMPRDRRSQLGEGAFSVLVWSHRIFFFLFFYLRDVGDLL